ncbi:unnamed protein product [Trichobilharzia szidati]|nr:unnamed protein product [Trichobilharzia szidati]
MLCLLVHIHGGNGENIAEGDNEEHDAEGDNEEHDAEGDNEEHDADGAAKFIADYDPNLTLDAYAESYSQILKDKFFIIELETYVDPQNAEEAIKREILRLEHLYQSKWAKEFLESIDAADKNLVNFYTDEYKKALEEDKASEYKLHAHPKSFDRVKTHISSKWENRKNLDIAEGKFFAEASGNLKKDKDLIEITQKNLMEAKEVVKTLKAQIKLLETAAVKASNAYRKTSAYLRRINRETDTSDSPDDVETTQVYEKARSDLDNATKELKEKIKLLEMKRIEFSKFQTPQDRINWLLAEMKEDAMQYY